MTEIKKKKSDETCGGCVFLSGNMCIRPAATKDVPGLFVPRSDFSSTRCSFYRAKDTANITGNKQNMNTKSKNNENKIRGLWDYVLKLTDESASDKSKTTIIHLLYAYAKIVNMSDDLLLKNVYTDNYNAKIMLSIVNRIRNMKIQYNFKSRGITTLLVDASGEEEGSIGFSALKELLPECISSFEKIPELHDDFIYSLEIFKSYYLGKAGLEWSGREDAFEEIFNNMLFLKGLCFLLTADGESEFNHFVTDSYEFRGYSETKHENIGVPQYEFDERKTYYDDPIIPDSYKIWINNAQYTGFVINSVLRNHALIKKLLYSEGLINHYINNSDIREKLDLDDYISFLLKSDSKFSGKKDTIKAFYLEHDLDMEVWQTYLDPTDQTDFDDYEASEDNPDTKNNTGTYDFKHICKNIHETVIGQYDAVENFIKALKRNFIFPKRPGKPLAVFLLAGPPGVGKTLLAESLHKEMHRPYKRIDMSEYAGGEQAHEGLIGFESTYKKTQKGVLTSFVNDNPNAIILFDEIEKAGNSVKKILLQVVDDARLTDKNLQKTISFENTILIFTTNAGSQLYTDNYSENLSMLPLDTIKTAISRDKQFPNELLSRFAANNIIMFNHIPKNYLIDIAKGAMNRIKENLNVRVDLSETEAEALSQLLILHEGNKADARMISAKAAAVVENAVLDYMDFEDSMAQPEGAELPVIKLWVEDTDSEACSYVFPREEKPVNIVYFPCDYDKKAVRKLTKLFDSYCCHLDVAEKQDELFDLIENAEHDMIVIDTTARPLSENEEDNLVFSLEVNSEGNNSLNMLINSKYKSKLYVVDSGLMPHEEQILNKNGINRILPDLLSEGSPFKTGKAISDHYHNNFIHPWIKQARRVNVVKSMELLSETDKIVDYHTEVIDGTGVKFTKLNLIDAGFIDSETRLNDRSSLLSDAKRPTERFDDIIGNENAKRELGQFIKFVKDPQYAKAYEDLGQSAPTGLLLYGPPGTGKTMLAKATAGECGMSFIAANASDFFKPVVGEGEAQLCRLFDTAKRNSPAIIFIDEIDTIGKERTGESEGTKGSEEALLNTLLTQMDGFSNIKDKQIFIIAATNFDLDGTKSGKRVTLDAALARRFSTRIYIDLPGKDEQLAYVTKYFEKICQKSDRLHINTEDIMQLASSLTEHTAGQSLSIIKNILDYSIRHFIDNSENITKNKKFTEQFLLECMQEMQFGEKTGAVKPETAYHEAGHALMTYLTGEIPTFLTIVPRGDFGGYARRKVTEEANYTEDKWRTLIKISLAGRAGEKIYYKYFDKNRSKNEEENLKKAVNTGAGSDLEHATHFAKMIVTRLGRDDDHLAIIPEKDYSDKMNQEMQDEINHILADEMKETTEMLEKNKDLLINLP